MLRGVDSKSRVKCVGRNGQICTAYSSVSRRELCSSTCTSTVYLLAQAAFVPSCKTAPLERPRDTTAMSLLLCKQHSSVSVLVVVRGATVDFRPPPVLCRMVIASPGSFASLGCTTASCETCSYWSHTQFLALKLSRTAGRLARRIFFS